MGAKLLCNLKQFNPTKKRVFEDKLSRKTELCMAMSLTTLIIMTMPQTELPNSRKA